MAFDRSVLRLEELNTKDHIGRYRYEGVVTGELLTKEVIDEVRYPEDILASFTH
jgi:hypothetical protein